jgi:hypothetical protein
MVAGQVAVESDPTGDQICSTMLAGSSAGVGDCPVEDETEMASDDDNLSLEELRRPRKI